MGQSTEPTWLDITCDVHDVEIDQGRDRTISRWQVGSCSITVDNTTGVYDVNTAPSSPRDPVGATGPSGAGRHRLGRR